MTKSRISERDAPSKENQDTEITITVNGIPSTVTEGDTLDQLLVKHGLPHQGVAVAVNGELALRSQWETTRLNPGTSVEIVTIAQGG